MVQFKRGGSLFLEVYFFKSKEGSFNKDEQSIELNQGQGFLNDRNYFSATKILAKHDENYMPPEVNEALGEK